MLHERITEVKVTLGEGTVVIRRSGQSYPVIANILGQEANAQGEVVKVVLDRLVHSPAESNFVDWSVSGAVVSELRRVFPKPALVS